jgi:hypothetical protein
MKVIQKILSSHSKIFARFGISKSTWNKQNLPSANDITQADSSYYGAGMTISSLLVSGQKKARSRQLIYDKWSQM